MCKIWASKVEVEWRNWTWKFVSVCVCSKANSKDNYLSKILNKNSVGKKIKWHLVRKLLVKWQNTICNLLEHTSGYKVTDCFFLIRPLLERRCQNTLKLTPTLKHNCEQQPWQKMMIVMSFCSFGLILLEFILRILKINNDLKEYQHQTRSS